MNHRALLAIMCVAAGCGQAPAPPVAPAPAAGHAHTPPPGAVGVPIGDHVAHLALWLTPGSGTLVVHVYDGHFEGTLRVPEPVLSLQVTPEGAAAPVTVRLEAQADPLSGETVGNTAVFRGQADVLRGVARFRAVVERLTVRGDVLTDLAFRYPDGEDDAPAAGH